MGNFKDQESGTPHQCQSKHGFKMLRVWPYTDFGASAGKTGASGVAADGKERLAEYKKDKADDGKINYMQVGLWGVPVINLCAIFCHTSVPYFAIFR